MGLNHVALVAASYRFNERQRSLLNQHKGFVVEPENFSHVTLTVRNQVGGQSWFESALWLDSSYM